MCPKFLYVTDFRHLRGKNRAEGAALKEKEKKTIRSLAFLEKYFHFLKILDCAHASSMFQLTPF